MLNSVLLRKPLWQLVDLRPSSGSPSAVVLNPILVLLNSLLTELRAQAPMPEIRDSDGIGLGKFVGDGTSSCGHLTIYIETAILLLSQNLTNLCRMR
jgi:hypothetical protein